MHRCISACGFLMPALLLLSGCQCFNDRFEPMAHNPIWDPVLGSCDVCGSCGGDCEGHTPCSYAKHTLTCASGCSEIYWGEWSSDPPDPCDPCDNCGNWVGAQCCGPSLLDQLCAGWHSFWGYRAGCGVEGTMYGPALHPMVDPLTEDVFLEGEMLPPPESFEVMPGAESPQEVAPPRPVPDSQVRREHSAELHWRSSPIRSQRFAR